MNDIGSKAVTARNGRSRQSLIRLIILFCVVILSLNAAIVYKRASDARELAINEGKRTIERLTHTIAENIELTFLTVDLTLKRAGERQYFNLLFGSNLMDDIRNNFRQWVEETPQINAMLMTDASGNVQIYYHEETSQALFEIGQSLEENIFFREHSLSDGLDSLYVGTYQQNGDEFVVMSRAYSKLDGTFGGIFLAAVNSDYVSNFFRAIESDRQTRLVLSRDDQSILINELPDRQETGVWENLSLEHPVNDTTLISTALVKNSQVDGRLRIYSFRAIPNLHMIASVVGYEQDLLAEWRRTRINDLTFLGIFALFVFAISFFAVAVARQMNRVQRSERAAVLASQAKSDFLANMSHELRTPLNAIIGFSEMMIAGYFGKLNKKQEERIQDMHSCGNHLLSLINDILEFSKGEAGKIELRNDKVSIPRIIKDVKRILSEKARRDNVKLLMDIPDDFPLIIGDERKLKQILLNLVSNSLKFTAAEGLIEMSCAIDETGNILLVVTDTGKGMKEAEIPKALSAFGQVHSDPSKGGTGLGLPLCKMFAELHGGNLTIQSIENVGTKVTITLPGERIINNGLPD